jgi:hypothetical protein
MSGSSNKAQSIYLTGLRNQHAVEQQAIQLLERQFGRLENYRNCPGSSAKSGLWPRQRPESQFFQRKFAYRPPLRGGTWAPSRGTWAVTNQTTKTVLRRPLESAQYASEPYRMVLERHGITQSMSRRGNCLDNAPMESFFASLKTEHVHQVCFHTREEAKAAVFDYIEVFYTRQRLHSGVGYRTPVEARASMEAITMRAVA